MYKNHEANQRFVRIFRGKFLIKTSKGHFNKKLFRSAFVQEQVFFDEAYKTQARTKNAPLMDKKTQENGGS
jgi:hypothetical protein